MVQSNKILTVSYGTFSCTLEGFDDAFGTMKAIAEYFRDLAAEDRYFGAEPPQPDTDMLAHIAQKEISRRVEAHRDETGIVLRAEEPAAVTATAATQTVQSDIVEEHDAAPAHQGGAKAPAEIIVEEPLTASDVDAASADEGAAAFFEDTPIVAEDLTEDGVDETPPTTPEVEPVAAEVEAEVEAEAQQDAPDMIAQTMAAEAEAVEPEISEDTPVADPDAVDVDVDVEDVTPAPTEAPAADSIAAKLQRIRAVVSRSSATKTQDFSEDEHAEPIATSGVAENISSLIANVQTPDAPQDAESEDAPDSADLDLDAHLDALEDAPAPLTDDIDEEVSAADDLTADGDDQPVAEAGTLESILAEAQEDDTPEEEPRAKARVVKVSREEFDALLAADRGEALPTVDLSDTGAAEDDSSLSPEDEADLMRELAEVEAELHEAPEDVHEDPLEEEDEIDSIFAEAAGDLQSPTEEDEDFAEERAILSGDADADVSRIMEQADDRLSDPETSDRRSEFAHLRAAMAAGKAEEAAGGSISEPRSEGDYREDLARVVRPRRPEAAESRERSRRPQDEKPAPLKLVAAQRVDAEHAPVQPRRVMSRPVEDTYEDGADGKMKFADYAEGVGAVELPDLLEAAAAYLSFVEGQEQFSRPQLMTKVRMVGQEDFSREDGLRSFGLLLRDGKIEKTQAGRFTVSDRIGFRPEDMRAAG